ncbi:MAG: nucleotide exchange factor GrpE [Bacillota bacterium]|nr:nucleotide exchange factor GrpE [Bacillota bacterium]
MVMTKVNGEDVVKEDIKDTETEEATSEKVAEDAVKEETKEEVKEEKAPEEDGDAKYLRLMADFQNYKKRVEKEKTDLYSYANEKIVTELLDVLDNFERALSHEDAGDGFKEGMEMIFKQLLGVLEKSGLAEIPALGEDFDPNFHNAVMTEETEEYESGKVSGVLQKGYTLNGKVIRPTMVKVVG